MVSRLRRLRLDLHLGQRRGRRRGGRRGLAHGALDPLDERGGSGVGWGCVCFSFFFTVFFHGFSVFLEKGSFRVLVGGFGLVRLVG